MNAQDVIVRLERHDDERTIRLVNEAAFGRTAEADLVDRLRQEFAVLASLVAEHDGRLIGHLLFSRVMIDTAGEPLLSVALAPMSVLPSDQRRGVGSRLIVSGLDWLRARNERSVLVLGAPEVLTGASGSPAIARVCSRIPFRPTHSWHWSWCRARSTAFREPSDIPRRSTCSPGGVPASSRCLRSGAG